MNSTSTRGGATTAKPSDLIHDVAVVGAGLVGLATALGAAQAGLDVALIGATPPGAPATEPWDRRIYAISPATRHFLERLRVWQQLDPERVRAVREMRVFSHAGAPRPLQFSAYEAGSDALAWILEHRELARVLNVALDFQHGVTRIRAEATDLRVDAGVAQVFTDADHANAAPRAALLIGADGAASRVRAAAGLSSSERPYGQTGVVANFSCTRPHGGTALQWFTDEGIVALLPLPGDAVSLVWSAPTALAEALVAMSPEALAQRVSALSGALTGALAPLGTAQGFPLRLLVTPRQIAPRVALVGDAAHVLHPLAGQGLNMGLLDAEALIDILRERERFRDCGDVVLLRRYERARAEPLLAMRSVTDGLQRLFGAADPLARRLRTDGMNLIERLPVIKNALIRRAMG